MIETTYIKFGKEPGRIIRVIQNIWVKIQHIQNKLLSCLKN